MALGRGRQGDTKFYALIIFVGLFLICLTVAVIYYIKAENYMNKAATLQNQTDELASPAELRKIGKLVGEKQRKKSRLGTMLDYVDQMVALITGTVPDDGSAEVKVAAAKQQAKDTLESLAKEHDIKADAPNSVGLIRTLEKSKTKLDDNKAEIASLRQQLSGLQGKFDDAMTASAEKEQTLLAEKEKYRQQVEKVQEDYNELKALTKQTSEQQVKTLMSQVDEERNARKALNQNLLKTEAELTLAQERIKLTLGKLQGIVPPPDSEVAAYKPDARVILIDDKTKVVHLNIGSDDRVYRGLTFSVYDKNMPIPKDGKGKAEIEVFNVSKNISAARITQSSPKNPIILDDIVANLIWDSEKTNVFVVAGAFDLDNDGELDYKAADKIKGLIEKWGGRAEDSISVSTDFLILGEGPKVSAKPSFEQTEVDPMAIERYEASLRQLKQYKEIQSQSQALSIPIFNGERFLYFIGYKSQADRPGAF